MDQVITEQELLTAAENSIRKALPNEVRVALRPARASRQGPQADAILELGFGENVINFQVEARITSNFAKNLSAAIKLLPSQVTPVVFVTRYVQQSVRQIMQKSGQSYIDTTGNVFLYRSDPPIVISAEGASTDPLAKPGRPITSLKGNPAGLVVRTLLENKAPLSVAEVIEKSGGSRGAVYRALDFLEEASLIERRERGIITSVNWRKLLELWADNYDVLKSNRVKRYIAPRGIEDLKVRLREVDDLEYAATGSLAAEPYSNYAPTYSALLYTKDMRGLAARLNLQETDKGADVLLIEPVGDFQMKNSEPVNGIQLVSPTQAAVDLLNGPGRNPEEGKALMSWLESNNDWR
jgi:hypothetical protein